MNRQKTITINYYWCDAEDPLIPIRSTHIEALEKKADEIIKEQMDGGFTEGYLADNIFMNDEDINSRGQEGIDYLGYWSANIDNGVSE